MAPPEDAAPIRRLRARVKHRGFGGAAQRGVHALGWNARAMQRQRFPPYPVVNPAYVPLKAAITRGRSMVDGVIYVARGAGYLDLAIASAQSLRALEPAILIDIFTDVEVPANAPFDNVAPIPHSGTRDKIACMVRTRFDCTLFLDCDTLVLAPLGDLFRLLTRVDLAVAHDVRRVSALIQESGIPDVPEAFPQFNTGVLLYRHTPLVQQFMADWAARYVALGVGRDQVSFRDLMWLGDLRYHVLAPEYNLRRVTELDAWEPMDARPTILHSHRLLQHLRGQGPRLRDLAEILHLERVALAVEWAALGLPAVSAPGEDPVARFLEAEVRHPESARSVGPCRGVAGRG